MSYLKFLSFSISVILFADCTHDKGIDINPITTTSVSGCDTLATISYSAQIAPIISQNCISCHGSSNSGTRLHDYANVQAKALIPGGHGSLYSAVSQNGNAYPMPPNGPKLSDCDLAKIKKWVDAGAPSN